MLSPEEEKRLESLIEDIGTEGMLDATQIRWVVSRLKEINDKCKEHQHCLCTPHKETIKEVRYPNPLTMQTDKGKIAVAFWTGDTYKCIFCVEYHSVNQQTALDHAIDDLKRKDNVQRK